MRDISKEMARIKCNLDESSKSNFVIFSKSRMFSTIEINNLLSEYYEKLTL